jgi:hypothetical protein
MGFRKYPKARKKGEGLFPLKNVYEDCVALQLAGHYSLPVEDIIAECYEAEKIPYTIEHDYYPDFKLPNGVFVEVKGLFDVEDRRKQLAVKVQHPDLDIRIVFVKANTPISRGSKSTYATWCDKHKIQWSSGKIPDSWFD